MKLRKRRFRRNLIYYPAAGAVALSSLFGVKRPPKTQQQEQPFLTGRAGENTRVGSKPTYTANKPLAENASPQEVLAEAARRCEVAKQHLEQGNLAQSGVESDEAYTMLSRLPAGLDSEQDRLRNEVRLDLSHLIVLLNEAHAGPSLAMAQPAMQLNPIQMEMNNRIQQEIDLFQTTQRQTFIQGYQLAGAHMPYIEKKLEDRGMPRELGWLPLIESGFKPKAQSQVAALGLWQFMPATGEQLGLAQNRWIDDRMDPEQATDAALTYLKYLHQTFGGDWEKALAAYNWGEGNMRKAMKKLHRPEDEITFWDLTPKLPEETARYVPKFLAAVHIANDPGAYGFKRPDLGVPSVPLRYELVTTEKQMDMDQIAHRLGVKPSVLQNLNPELLQRVTPPQKHILRVPPGKSDSLVAMLQKDDIPEYRPQPKVEEALVAARLAKPRVKRGKPMHVPAQVAKARAGKLGKRGQVAVQKAKAGKKAAKATAVKAKAAKPRTVKKGGRRA